MFKRITTRWAIAVAWLPLFVGTAGANTLSGAGSSAAAPIYRSWAAAYEKVSGQRLDYDPAGSSAGLRKIRTREVGYGATDVAPSAAELQKDGLALFPIAITGIAPVVNLPRVSAGQLRLSGPVLARIYLGQITQWNAPEIGQLNPGLTLPALPIRVIVRSDGSGTTYNFSDYLAKTHAEWRERMGVKTSMNWPDTFVGAKGSEGVVKAVRDTVGGIGYVDFGYVRDHQLVTVQLPDRQGEFLQPSNEGFRAALSSSDWVSSGNFSTTLTDMPGRRAWPLTMATYAVVPLVADKPEEMRRVLGFFSWAFLNGDTLVQENNFVRLPTRVQAAVFKIISSIKDSSGQPIGVKLSGF